MPIDPATGESPSPRAVASRYRFRLIVTCAAIAAALVALVAWGPWNRKPERSRSEAGLSKVQGIGRKAPKFLDVPYEAPGILTPKVESARNVSLPDDEPVIGVRAGGKARAYAIASLNKSPEHHIVNDLVGGAPITVAHCAALRCSRAFTRSLRKTPLDVSQAGFLDGGMAIRIAGRIYRMKDLSPLQDGDPPLALDEHPCKVTTWKQWRLENPETEIYAPL
jgi:hypothetical protein